LLAFILLSSYGKNKNLDVKNGLVMMGTVLLVTLFGSWVASKVPNTTMGNFSVFMTLLLGIKFIVKPVMTTKESMNQVSGKKRVIQSVICGTVVGFICGFVGAGGGMMMLLILTSVLGYELKKFANKATPATLNRATGVVLAVLGAVILGVNYLK